MGKAKSSKENDDVEEEEEFLDAFDDFPFYDCSESFSLPERIESDADVASPSVSVVTLDSRPSSEKSSPASLRRRRFTSRDDSVSSGNNYVISRDAMLRFSEKLEENGAENEGGNGKFWWNSEKIDEIKLNLGSGGVKNGESEDFDDENKENLKISCTNNEKNVESEGFDYENQENLKISCTNNERNGESEGFDFENQENLKISYTNNESIEQYDEENSSVRETPAEVSSLLIILAGLVVKAIGFQFNLLFSFLTFPIWATYTSYIFVMDPFGFMKRGREKLIRQGKGISGYFFGYISSFVNEWIEEHKSWLKLGLKFGWGLLWSVYVCVVLVALLVSAFVVGGILMNAVVEEPITIKKNLNFDYTEKSPTAFVPIIGCPGEGCGLECGEKFDAVKFEGMRVIPLDHKLQVTVSLRLPESDYNRNLGIFQVKVDFLGPDGKSLASSRHPCMLQFKSEPIRLLLTFLKVAPLLTGYVSESQDLNIKFRGFTEGGRPTSCLRVTIEQRAQFAPGAGIPEIYDASLTLESEQPLLKRIVWYWRKTLFIWVSMTIFTVELVFALVCCNSIIIPRVRLGSATNGAPQDNGPIQR